MANLNYKHLHYFWVVAHEGSMTRAAERLGVAVQTISGQLSLLERSLGRAAVRQPGARTLALSDAGRAALGYRRPDLPARRGAARKRCARPTAPASLRLRAGISDGIPEAARLPVCSSLGAGDARRRASGL
jgi:LysR family transcriptional activator of nhaA